MDRSSVDQAVAFLTSARRGLLLVVPADPPIDAFAAMAGLSLALDEMQKPSTAVCPSHVPPPLQFLPGTSQVRDAIPATPELRLEIPLGDRRPGDVRWEMRGSVLSITIQPDNARPFPETEVRVHRGEYPWDGIITIGAARLHALGELFTRHTGFFYNTPILNIDRGTTNEFFGAVNLVSATAGTVSEVVADLIEALGGTRLFTPEVATCLLAGLMAGSESFRAPWTTPRMFRRASQLVLQKADQQAVVRSLFQTHTIPELRLLGRALTRMEELGEHALWTTLTREDFAAAGGTPDAAPTIMRDLLHWVGEQRALILALERTAGTVETLTAVGRVSVDDREAFRTALHGALVGPFVLVNLGRVAAADVRRVVTETVLPRIPRPPHAPSPESAPSDRPGKPALA